MHRKLLLVILQATIIFLCANSKCSHDAFDCGNIGYIAYPFWVGSLIQGCGKEGYQIECQGGVPILNISALSYRVKELDFNSNTIKLSRQDLYNTICPKVLRNTTIDYRLFEYPETPTDQNLTLYYNCSADGQLPNEFSCGGQSANYFETGDVLSGPGPNITCNDSIIVPINSELAQSLHNPTASSVNVLRAALDSGFSIQWIHDPVQNDATVCNRNVNGSCIRSKNNRKRPCTYNNSCGRRSDNNASTPEQHPVQTAPSPSDRQIGEGMRPSQGPGYAPHGSNSRSPAKKVLIAVLLSIAGVAVSSMLVYYFIERRYSAKAQLNKESNHYVEEFLSQHGSLAPRRYRYSEIKKITKSFSVNLGKGGYGSVYKGALPDGSLVAVKVLMETDSNGEEFINEVASISRTSHVNIVGLLGFCYEGSQRALIYEFMTNKSLDKFLSNKGDTDYCLGLEKLLEISVGIAKGLEYLHTGCSTRIVHFDIKPQNILLDEDLCPKISDFGLAKLCKKKQSVLSVLGTRGTIGYIAPEVFSRNFGGVSHKSDVYSYGMMVLEMIGVKSDVETTPEMAPSSENYFPDQIYEQLMLDVSNKSNDLMVEEEGEETRRKMFLIGFWCIQTMPSDRPSMSKVVEMLEGSLQSIRIPPKPFLFTPSLPGQEFSSTFSAHVETESSAQD